jgi:hypothetical protein
MIATAFRWLIVIAIALFVYHHTQESGDFIKEAVTRFSAFVASL